MDGTALVRKWEEFAIGDSAEICKTIAIADLVSWSRLTGEANSQDWHLLGGSKNRGANQAVPDYFIMGILSAAITKVCYGQVVLEQETSFYKPVFIGDTITARATVIDKLEEHHTVKLQTVAINQLGEIVTDGYGLEYILEA